MDANEQVTPKQENLSDCLFSSFVAPARHEARPHRDNDVNVSAQMMHPASNRSLAHARPHSSASPMAVCQPPSILTRPARSTLRSVSPMPLFNRPRYVALPKVWGQHHSDSCQKATTTRSSLSGHDQPAHRPTYGRRGKVFTCKPAQRLALGSLPAAVQFNNSAHRIISRPALTIY